MKKEKRVYSEEDISKFCKKYSIQKTSNREKLVIDFALKGQEELYNNNIESTDEICELLLNLSDLWKDEFSKVKALLLRAQLASYINEDSIKFLSEGLKVARKLKLEDIILGIRVQLAFELFKNRDYKGVLKEIKEVEKQSELNDENTRVISELKARSFWEKDDYINGFKATLNWYNLIKSSSEDLSVLFIVIVYILTVMSSITLPYSEKEINEIKNDIKATLSNLATSTHLFNAIIPNIDTLFAKSLMLVEPEILHEFTDLFLQTSRWMDEEKYLFLCQKIADAFYNINDFEKSTELMDRAHQYIKEKKYDKIESIIRFKKAEYSSLIFYFMSFDPLFDPYEINTVHIVDEKQKKDLFLQVLSAPINSFPATSYSHFLRIIEKANKRYTKEDSLRITGISKEEERCFFVLDLQLADENLKLLMKEDFQIERNHTLTLQSTVSPYYSIIGILSDKISDQKEISEIKDIESILLKIQRAINCPASKAVLYLPEKPPHLNLFQFYLEGGGFRDIKTKILDSARNLHKKYDFAKNHDFLQIFQSDPITIFDLSLREVEHLSPLTNLIVSAYGIKIANEVLSQFLKDMIDSFLKRSDARFWRDFYYQYSWLQIKGVYLSLENEELPKKKRLSKELISLSKKLKEHEKILESNYFETYLHLIEKNSSFINKARNLKELSDQYGNQKYSIIADLMMQIAQEKSLDNEEFLMNITNLFCELCEYKDWSTSLELFFVLLSRIEGISTMFEICRNKEVADTGIILYLHLSKHLVEIENYHFASSMLHWLINTLLQRRELFHLSKHTWNYLFVKANQLLYEIFEKIPPVELKKYEITKSGIVTDLLEYSEWIENQVLLVEILNDQITIHLDKKNLTQAKKAYHWIEQVLYYSWDIFTLDENSDLIHKIQQTKKRIESYHFT